KRRAVTLPAEPSVNRAVERDAVPGQLAVRFDKVPKAGARLGRGVGGLHSAAGASGREDRCSKNAELRHGSPPAPTWTIVTWKMSVTRHIPTLAKNFDPSGVRATVTYTVKSVRPRSILGWLSEISRFPGAVIAAEPGKYVPWLGSESF